MPTLDPHLIVKVAGTAPMKRGKRLGSSSAIYLDTMLHLKMQGKVDHN